MASSADEKAAEYRRLAQDARARANQILLWNVREKLLAKARQWEAWAETAERLGEEAPAQNPKADE
jgi:hypothetical protein